MDSPLVALASLVVVAPTLGLMTCFRVAKPASYLVRTGLFINEKMGMKVSRKCVYLPGLQTLQHVAMQPRNLKLELKCLSKEYLPFKLPITATLSPFDPDGVVMEEVLESNETNIVSAEVLFKRYVQKIHPLDDDAFNITVEGLLHGEIRVLAAKMSIDELNDDREAFKSNVSKKIQQLLLGYGLRFDNANIAELKEEKRENGAVGYLEAREKKKLSDAVQQSEINVAEATKNGDIGKKQREAETRCERAKLEASTKEIEFASQEHIQKSHANLLVVTAASNQRAEVSSIEAIAAAELKKQELQSKIEEYKANQLLFAKRADTLTSEKGKAECLKVATDMERDAFITQATGKAEAMEIEAKAMRFQGEQKAAVILAELNAKAQGELALLDAQAIGTRKLVEACEGKPELIVALMGIYHGIPQTTAKENANAMQGLKPQIWSMSGDDAGSQIAKFMAGVAPVVDIYQKMLK